jgi:hypothetical protein
MERQLILYWLLIFTAVNGIHLSIHKTNTLTNTHINTHRAYYLCVTLIFQGLLLFNTLIAEQVDYHELYVETFIMLVTVFMI